ncbi:TPA: hypothetical protein ACQVKY_005502 [Serratia marcescens]|uniref:DUF4760 domain-containing protein n=1 Tax=Serratia nevei TaxID=2703794 RepID=A0ABT7G5K3_9GAMM|nr:hypothetical protein [Serratia nevei]HAU4290863.1 hypothetical protein [Serratia marcescens]MDK5169034.1 hypothetical protein [Serratia nevei]MDK5298528.1 hypothetical protein [Serratia nevei]MEC5887220.1 hypothetical protein [Serratia nevei]HAU4297483.1 hypothetical protein [Serratia marcescens]
MEPSYIFISVLAVIAARLIYDTTIGKRKAMKTLLDLAQKQDDIRKVYDKIKQIELGQHPSIKPNDELNAFRQINLSYAMLIRMHEQCRLLDKTLFDQWNFLTRHDALKLSKKYDWLKSSWIAREQLIYGQSNFAQTCKRYIRQIYDPTNMQTLEITKEIFETNPMIEEIKLNENRTIDAERVQQDIDKWNLNQKLQATLPPRPKTKVVKI